MKKFKLLMVVSIIIVAITATFLLSGCSSPYNSFADQGQKDISKGAPVLKVATNAEFAPFEYMENSKFDGYDIAMINAIATNLGMKVELKNIEFDGIIAALQTGGFDVAVAAITVNDERSEKVDFSESYFNSAQVIVVKDNVTKFDNMDKDQIVKALENTNIHVATGQVGDYFATGSVGFDYPGIAGATVKHYSTVTLAAQGILKEEAAFFDKDVARNFVASASGFKMIDVDLTVEEYAIAITKGKTDLKDKINKALFELKVDGTIEKIKQHYKLI